MSASLAALPAEVIQAIVQHLDASSLSALSLTSTQFNALTNEPLLWKALCTREFRFWDPRHAYDKKQKDPTFQDWRDFYSSRAQEARATKSAISQIIDQLPLRLESLQTIIEFGYSAKDTLVRLIQDAKSSKSPLAQRYWTYLALGAVNRNVAIKEWAKLKSSEFVSQPTERGLAALDMFVLESSLDGDIDDTLARLDLYAQSIRTKYPAIDEQTPVQRAQTIAKHLMDNKWLSIDSQRNYHALDNMFLGIAVRSSHRNSLPLVSAVIYCYVCRQFDLRAQPCSFPLHVHAVVQPLDQSIDINGQPLPSNHEHSDVSSLTHIYMDPFNTDGPIPLTSLLRQAQFIAPNAGRDQVTSYLTPARPYDLITRNAHNILNSVTSHEDSHTHPIPAVDAAYAAFYALIFFPSHPTTLHSNIRDLTQHFIHFFPHDLHNFTTHILPLTSSFPDHAEYRNLCHAIAQDFQAPRRPKYRSREPYRIVKYKVGQVFKHKRRNYTAVIYGWDNTCKQSDDWITGNRVDDLPNGRGQPFYHVLVDDATTRYVAQENIDLLGPGDIEETDVDRFSIEIGKWFRRYDKDTGTFVSNVREEYPED